MRPGLDYGLSVCPECHRGVAAELLEVTGQTKLDVAPFQKGRRVVTGTIRRASGIETKVEDRGPRFGPEHRREWAEVRDPLCGRTFWRSGPLALEDARAIGSRKPLRALPKGKK